MAEEIERCRVEAVPVEMSMERIAWQLINTWRCACFTDCDVGVVVSLGWTCSSEVARSQDVGHVMQNMKKI